MIAAPSRVLHNAPKLYSDDAVRTLNKISGSGSELEAAEKELDLGFFDDFTDLVTQPSQEAGKEGAIGFVKRSKALQRASEARDLKSFAGNRATPLVGGSRGTTTSGWCGTIKPLIVLSSNHFRVAIPAPRVFLCHGHTFIHSRGYK